MAQAKTNIETELKSVEQVAAQLEAAKDSTRETRTAAKMFQGVASKVESLLPNEGHAGFDTDTETLVKLLNQFADELNPVAEENFVEGDLEKTISRLNAAALVPDLTGMTPEQVDRLEKAVTSIRSYKKSTGTRTPQERLEGRPDYVIVHAVNGDKISRQVGNTRTARGNVLNGVVRWLAAKGVEVSEAQKESIGEAIAEVTEGRKTSNKLGDFATIKVD
jgi:hypothetical protein